MDHISKHTLDFLTALKKNNNREWFGAHRADYEQSLEEVRAFADHVIELVNTFDVLETPDGKKSLMRIYRDVRFSKNKSPYKTNWGGGLKRAGANRRGGMYFHIAPGEHFVGGGFWGPSKENLLHVRKQIAADPSPLRNVINSKEFSDAFGELHGDQLKTAPKGFDKEDPNIDLLRYKQYLVSKNFTDKEATSAGYAEKVAEGFKQMLPFFDAMTEYLTTDLNGTPL
jgi:uncharacterized protein (TIGR02453 family)